MSARTFAYWATTAITVFMLLSGGLAYLLRADFAVGGVTALGYPTYVVTILGVWKLLAVPALLVPRLGRLREWAYAGIVFDLTGAAASHLVVGNPAFHQIMIGGLLCAAFASRALRPTDRAAADPTPRATARLAHP
ncbi:DoxX family protein [Pseudonocardia cypriaca]|uniref:DoxX-like protein n=1 Tax=Pseudonocardia cypriaca TaxID=882449 RepID=A0A543FR57_9PSEU|nr:DoxX family protein [Pseudonocardia cypriaca]TQM36322.1 DoxX-like protein [Pseudonocardia cypriaca]